MEPVDPTPAPVSAPVVDDVPAMSVVTTFVSEIEQSNGQVPTNLATPNFNAIFGAGCSVVATRMRCDEGVTNTFSLQMLSAQSISLITAISGAMTLTEFNNFLSSHTGNAVSINHNYIQHADMIIDHCEPFMQKCVSAC